MSRPATNGLLQSACEDLRALIALLARERAHLVDGPEGLMEAVEEKNRLLDRLAERRAELHAVRTELAADPSWNELERLAARAREDNRINGALIRRRLDATRLALSALRARIGEPAVYGRDGQLQPLGR